MICLAPMSTNLRPISVDVPWIIFAINSSMIGALTTAAMTSLSSNHAL